MTVCSLESLRSSIGLAQEGGRFKMRRIRVQHQSKPKDLDLTLKFLR